MPPPTWETPRVTHKKFENNSSPESEPVIPFLASKSGHKIIMGVAAKIAPSMLSSDFANLASEAQRMLDCGADWLHMDIMVRLYIKTKKLNLWIFLSIDLIIFDKETDWFLFYNYCVCRMGITSIIVSFKNRLSLITANLWSSLYYLCYLRLLGLFIF